MKDLGIKWSSQSRPAGEPPAAYGNQEKKQRIGRHVVRKRGLDRGVTIRIVAWTTWIVSSVDLVSSVGQRGG
ncbi:hypothetical protein KQX54_019017 [Cotesia glomerata]|uniref:Uncharacterized protein n=1 Tax=Cotesia glomerata TaxID=32391 RepID=A0AAV7I6M1_COTGL|nr:hypothetical protein KQX54_019017 [Cotesia glomerata]